jgi:hypothetical protein
VQEARGLGWGMAAAVRSDRRSRRLRERARGNLVVSAAIRVTGRLNPSGERLLSAVWWRAAAVVCWFGRRIWWVRFAVDTAWMFGACVCGLWEWTHEDIF